MKKVVSLPSVSERHGVEEMLKRATDSGFESVIVFGFKDGRIHVLNSASIRRLEIIGALEAAKLMTWGIAEER